MSAIVIDTDQEEFSIIDELPKSTGALYRVMSEQDLVWSVDENNKVHINLGKEYARSLCSIEEFVRKIHQGATAFSVSNGMQGVELVQGELCRYYPMMNALINRYSKDRVYSGYVMAFFAVCITKHGMTAMSFPLDITMPSPDFPHLGWEIFNEIVNDILSVIQSRNFKKTTYAATESFKRGFQSSKDYVEKLFEKYSRILVLRVDFYYNPKMNKEFDKVTLEDVRGHLVKLLNNKRSRAIYNNLVGYIWRLEYGKRKGFHYHLFFFFDGAKSQKDAFLAWQIGKHWEEITGGIGLHHNCNMQKDGYKHLAIGMISHNNITKRTTLDNVLRYMHKETQVLKEKLLAKARTWGRGEMPIAKSSSVGRPRRSTMQ